MKKLISILLIIAFLIPSVTLADRSEQIKWRKRFSSLNDDGLNDVIIALQEVLFMHYISADGVKIPSGQYTVGTDIPPGTYRIEYKPLTETSFCNFLAVNEKTGFGYTTILGFDSSNEIGKIELTEGTEITLTGGDVYFYTYTGLFH